MTRLLCTLAFVLCFPMTAFAQTPATSPRFGVSVVDVDLGVVTDMLNQHYMQRRYRFDVDLWGIGTAIRVVEVQRHSLAAQMGLKVGDIIAGLIFYPDDSETRHISFTPDGRPDRQVSRADYEYAVEFGRQLKPMGPINAVGFAQTVEKLGDGFYLAAITFTGYGNGKYSIRSVRLDDPADQSTMKNQRGGEYRDQVERENIRRQGELSRRMEQQFQQWQSQMRDLNRP